MSDSIGKTSKIGQKKDMEENRSPNPTNLLGKNFRAKEMAKFWIAILLLIKAGSCYSDESSEHLSVPKAGIENKLEYRQRSIDDVKLIENRRADFLAHISHAKNIDLARNDSAFPWKIDWEKQKKFCIPIMNALFKNPTNLHFPVPIFNSAVSSRDQLQKVFGSNGCGIGIEQDLELNVDKNNQGEPLGASFSPWDKPGYSLRIYSSHQGENVFYIAEFLKPDANYAVDDPNRVRGAIPNSPILAKGFYLPVSNELRSSGSTHSDSSCMPGGYLESVGYPSSRSDRQKVIVVAVNGRLLVIEYGTYNNKLFEGYQNMLIIQASPARLLWGKEGQHYVLVKDIEKSFVDSWAKSRPPERFSVSNQLIEAISSDDTFYYACVINFDPLDQR